ncbi:MAG: hypothetical protein WAQ27_02535 [Candidatus Microsaccharimonas sp.]
MEDTTREIKEVHVLRATYRPSQPFAAALETFVKPGKLLPRTFLLGTKEAAVDLIEYSDFYYKRHETAARQAIQEFQKPIYIDPIMFYRTIGGGVLRLGFLPTNRSADYFHESLNALDTIPSILPTPDKPPHYYMYMDIPAGSAVDEDEQAKHYRELRHELAGRARTIYSVQPEDIAGHDERRSVVSTLVTE